jgi:spore germination protein GerM
MATAAGTSRCAKRQADVSSSTAKPLDPELGRIRASVERALLTAPPGGYAAIPKGVRLLSLSRAGAGAIVMDFSGELAAGGRGKALEDALQQILLAASNARTPTADRVDDYRVLINGVTLDAYLP